MSKLNPTGLVHLSVDPSPVLAQFVEDEHKLMGTDVESLFDYLVEKFLEGKVKAKALRQVYIKAKYAQDLTEHFSVVPEEVKLFLPAEVQEKGMSTGRVRRLRARRVRKITPYFGQEDPHFFLQSKLKVPGFYVSAQRAHDAKLEFSRSCDKSVFDQICNHKHSWGQLKKIRFIIAEGLEVDFLYQADNRKDLEIICTADCEYPEGESEAALAIIRSSITERLQNHLFLAPPESVAKQLLRNYWLAHEPVDVIKKMKAYRMPLPTLEESGRIRKKIELLKKKGSTS